MTPEEYKKQLLAKAKEDGFEIRGKIDVRNAPIFGMLRPETVQLILGVVKAEIEVIALPKKEDEKPVA